MHCQVFRHLVIGEFSHCLMSGDLYTLVRALRWHTIVKQNTVSLLSGEMLKRCGFRTGVVSLTHPHVAVASVADRSPRHTLKVHHSG